MPGEDGSYMWKGIIPQNENPHMRNPSRGYVSSANQLSVDWSYPYYTGNDFPVYRGYMINRYLDSMQNITAVDMQKLQNDNFLAQAEFSKDILTQIEVSQLSADSKKYYDIYKSWNFRDDPQEKGATVYDKWWAEFEKAVWSDEIDASGLPLPWPN
jgi:penicillin amidase